MWPFSKNKVKYTADLETPEQTRARRLSEAKIQYERDLDSARRLYISKRDDLIEKDKIDSESDGLPTS